MGEGRVGVGVMGRWGWVGEGDGRRVGDRGEDESEDFSEPSREASDGPTMGGPRAEPLMIESILKFDILALGLWSPASTRSLGREPRGAGDPPPWWREDGEGVGRWP